MFPPAFFTFPRDAAVRVMGVEDCKRADNFDPENARICSEHFREDYDESCCSTSFVLFVVLLHPRWKKDMPSYHGRLHRPSGEYLVITQE